ncbi:MAG: haloacid dehalogenase-like hydrolase, partial [Planctomycetota bacterium]
MTTKQILSTIYLLVILLASHLTAIAQDPLPSWNDGTAKQTVMTFVQRVTKQGTPDFVPASDRIAVFDNDGTLWAEQPIYIQLQFAIDRVKQLAAEHHEWQDQQPFKAVLEDDQAALAEAGEKGLVQLVMA